MPAPSRDYVFRIDVNLDRIMALFPDLSRQHRGMVLDELLAGQPMSLVRLFHAILLIPAHIHLTDDSRRVVLTRKVKDHDMMAKLELALRRLNDLRISGLNSRRIESVGMSSTITIQMASRWLESA